MKNKPDTLADAAELRRCAEAQLSGEQRSMIPSEDAARRLLHELQVHQVELEMQNEELRQSREKTEASMARFTKFFDFAPTSYLALQRDGAIHEINLTGASLIGLERSKLIGLRLGDFVAPEHHSAFHAFLAKVFSSDTKAVVEVALITADQRQLFVYIEAVANTSGQICRMSLMDITARKQAEEEIRKLSTAMEQSPSAIIITSRDGVIEYVNNAFSRITGYSREEVIGRNPNILQSGQVPEQDYQQLWQTVLSGKTWRGELPNKKKNGELYWDEVAIAPVMNDRDEITHLVGVQTDITERKQVALQIQTAKSRLQTIIDASADIIFMKDTGFRYLIANKAHEPLFNTPIANIIGKTDFDFMPRDAAERCRQSDRLALESEEAVCRDEFVNGRWFDIAKQSVRDAGGDVTGVIGVIRDITERKQAEESLKGLLQHHELILQTTQDGYWEVSMDGRLTEVNDTYCRMSGYSREELLAMHITDVEANEKPEETQAHIARIMDEGHDCFETRHRRKDGSLYELEISTSVVDQGDGRFFFAFLRDISERKQAQEELQKQVHKLERFNKMAVGREVKMIELKKEINELLGELGRGSKYVIHEPGGGNE